MPSKLRQCCSFIYSFKQLTWSRTTTTICLAPFALLLLILVILFLLSAEREGAVVSNSIVCASVGRSVLEEGGSAVDAAIATILCEGVAMPNSAGIGGGFTAVIYSTGKFDSIVATPTAPLAVNNITTFDESFTDGAKSAGVPGELKGLWEMHKKYGILSWKRLVDPSIELCEQGVPISEWLAGILKHNQERIAKSKTMGLIFEMVDTDALLAEQKLKYIRLAQTLKRIAKEGIKPFYEGDIGDEFITDITNGGGIMVKEDLENYKVLWDSNPPTLRLRNHFKIVSTPLPTSGAVVIFIMNIVKSFNLLNYPLFWHKFIEAMKHAFGRTSLLGDPVNDPEYRERILKVYLEMMDHDYARKIRDMIKDDKVFEDPEYYGSSYVPLATNGSANICVLSPRGDAVAATTSILSEFGAFFASCNTGIIVNNLLTRYQTNQYKMSPSLFNRPLPGKHSFSTFSPTIVIRQRTAVPFFIVGASGGPKATTLITTALVKYVLNASRTAETVNFRYLHNQLYPNHVEYEEEPESHVLQFLRKAGHEIVQMDATFENFSAMTCIGARYDNPDGAFDDRVGGSVASAHTRSDLNVLLCLIICGLAASVIGLICYEVLNPREYKLSLPKSEESLPTEV